MCLQIFCGVFLPVVDRVVSKFPTINQLSTVIVGSSVFPFSSLILLPIFCSSVIWGIHIQDAYVFLGVDPFVMM